MDKITRTSLRTRDKKSGGSLKVFSIIMLCCACVVLGYVLAGAFSGIFV